MCGELLDNPDVMKGGGSHSLKQGGPPRQWTKDGEAQLDTLVS
jgi:hypothetical protein